MAKQIKFGEEARRSLERVSMPWPILSRSRSDRKAVMLFWTRNTVLRLSLMTA